MHDETVELVTQAVNVLSAPLWEAQSSAMSETAIRCEGLNPHDHLSTWAHMTRSTMRLALEGSDLPEGWTVGGNPRKNELYLVNDQMRLRYLKESRAAYPGGVPAAGSSMARRAYWAQPLFETDRAGSRASGCDAIDLLLLWGYSQQDADDGFTMRVVHTTGVGRIGQRTPLDLSIAVTPTVGLEGGLRFNAQTESTNFFAWLDEDMNRNDVG
ncbi:hypothetical protein [Actinomyces urogenitalis]|uniref:hypothetical protein n=1 Tax=Actinomyces urogenitalis TaxID=103621 RepID=UPI00189C37AB|nr:hypothetical protein [Actinomyces urogenitalis]MDK8236776.1 hypothetical protein [Actinomyces urogenitalis]WOO94841.1 hypothetical protein R3I39_09170 [Actinomyces urogenitalis]